MGSSSVTWVREWGKGEKAGSDVSGNIIRIFYMYPKTVSSFLIRKVVSRTVERVLYII